MLKMSKESVQRFLIVIDLVFFVTVLLLAAYGALSSTFGLLTLLTWVAIFLATIVSFTVQLSQGPQGIEWYHYGIMFTSGMLIAMLLGLLVGFDIYGIAFLIPLAITGVILINWLFLDRSEDEVMKDLERLSKKIK